jgi:hypothetical protein
VWLVAVVLPLFFLTVLGRVQMRSGRWVLLAAVSLRLLSALANIVFHATSVYSVLLECDQPD